MKASDGRIHFYAMEFVEGATLKKLIERAGRLEANLALEIAARRSKPIWLRHTKQELVHRTSNQAISWRVWKRRRCDHGKSSIFASPRNSNETAGSQTAISKP
jgi:hypothetical protein